MKYIQSKCKSASSLYSRSVASAIFKSYAITDCQMCHFALWKNGGRTAGEFREKNITVVFLIVACALAVFFSVTNWYLRIEIDTKFNIAFDKSMIELDVGRKNVAIVKRDNLLSDLQ